MTTIPDVLQMEGLSTLLRLLSGLVRPDWASVTCRQGSGEGGVGELGLQVSRDSAAGLYSEAVARRQRRLPWQAFASWPLACRPLGVLCDLLPPAPAECAVSCSSCRQRGGRTKERVSLHATLP